MVCPAIELRLIANSTSTSQTDHVINVKGVNGRYFWDYHDPSISCHHVMNLSSVADVIDTFNNLAYALSWDVVPYRAIQVSVPAFPPVMIEMQELPRALEDVRQLLMSALYNVPQIMSAREAAEVMEDDVDMSEEDDDDDDDDDEEDEEDDDEVGDSEEDEEDDDEGEEDDDEDEEDDMEEDEEAEEGEDDCEANCHCEQDDAEYADMPPLVSASEANPEPPSLQSHSYYTRLQERLQNSRATAAAVEPVHSYFS